MWHDAGPVTRLASGEAVELILSGVVVALFRIDDRWHAMEGLCAHQNGPLAAGKVDAANGCVQCPWHGWRYQIADGKHVGSGQRLLQTYAVRERHGRIEIDVDGRQNEGSA
jgi:nitrite reductase (NADH) small subunit